MRPNGSCVLPWSIGALSGSKQSISGGGLEAAFEK